MPCAQTRALGGDGDNACPHHLAEVPALIEQAGARVRYLPPYSPQYNPIELACSVVKQQLRTLKAPTSQALY
jgi:transposase